MEVCLKAGGLFYVYTHLLQLMYATNYKQIIVPLEKALVELRTHKPSSFMSFSVRVIFSWCVDLFLSPIMLVQGILNSF